MTKRGIITVAVSILLALFTPIGLFIYITPIVIGCIGGHKVLEFYFKYFFGE